MWIERDLRECIWAVHEVVAQFIESEFHTSPSLHVRGRSAFDPESRRMLWGKPPRGRKEPFGALPHVKNNRRYNPAFIQASKRVETDK